MLCPGVLSGGGKEAVMLRSQMRGVFYYPPSGEEGGETSLCHLFGQEGSLTCVGFLFLSFQ